jgi:outer membrane protein TolC
VVRLAIGLSGILTCVLASLPLARARAQTSQVPTEAAPAIPTRTLRELLTDVQGRLVEVRMLDLRRSESEAELAHIRQSRSFEVDIEGHYRNEDVDRHERNGNNVKAGQQEDIRRSLTFAVTRPLLGLPLEQRIIVANEQQRLAELREEVVLARREAVLDVVGVYVELHAEQSLEPHRQRALELAGEQVRITEARRSRGESLPKDVLAARAQLAKRTQELATSRFRMEELRNLLSQMVEGTPPAPFRTAELDWSAMSPKIGEETETAPPPPVEKLDVAGIWYTLPEIDLTFYYTMQSRDRRFADEVDDEEGHTPGVQLTVEFPLDAYRAARSFARQSRARAERQRIAIESLTRQTSGLARQADLAHEAAQAQVDAAAADLAVREEELRITNLRAQGAVGENQQVAAIEAELAVIDARADLGEAQGELARRYFEHRLIVGEDLIELSAAVSRSEMGERAAAAGEAGASRTP